MPIPDLERIKINDLIKRMFSVEQKIDDVLEKNSTFEASISKDEMILIES